MVRRNGGIGELIPLLGLGAVVFIGYQFVTKGFGNGGGTIPAGDVFADIPDSDLFGDLLYV